MGLLSTNDSVGITDLFTRAKQAKRIEINDQHR